MIVACRGEQADGFEGDAVEPLLDRARFACPELASIGADSGFAAERVWRAAERRGIAAFIPPQPTMLPKAGKEATTDAQRQALAARARCKSPAGIEAHRQRMADAEGVIGELKNQGTAARAQRRGTPHFHVQLLLNCTAVNCKRLADHAPQAQSGVAAAPQTSDSAPPSRHAPHVSRRRSQPLARRPPRRRPLRLATTRSRSAEPVALLKGLLGQALRPLITEVAIATRVPPV